MSLPIEFSYKKLPETFYTETALNPIKDPTLFLYNEILAEQLNIKKYPSVEVLSGSATLGQPPIAQSYAGHQFGNFTMLGDGRALLLGEYIVDDERYDIQLKGSGRTIYSRGGDGRAPLGPMLREYIISEAMYALNIPTTRALAVVKTNEAVLRNGYETGAVLTRIARSHIRVGTFEYAAFMTDDIQALADYTIQRHYPECFNVQNPYLALLKIVIKKQAELIAQWQSVGFIHGVMNTDNMSIAGETIDYGPCAFMDEYNSNQVFSSIDIQGRYRFSNQPAIGKWNLARFAETLITLLDDDQENAVNIAMTALNEYDDLYMNYWLDIMTKKFGIQERKENDDVLILEFLNIMATNHYDYTNTFVDLMNQQLPETFIDWKKKWNKRINEENIEDVNQTMKANNPIVIPRNHLVEEAIKSAEQDNKTPLIDLINILRNPFDTQHAEKYRQPPTEKERVKQTFCGT